MRVLIIALLAATAWAQRIPADNRAWTASVVAVASASAADAATSWGLHEVNPILRGSDGRFGAKSVEIKAGLMAGMIVLEYLTRRQHRKAWTRLNLAAAGMFGVTAYRNESVRTIPPLAPVLAVHR